MNTQSDTAPAAQVAELENCDKCGYMTRNGAKCGCAAPAVVVDHATIERACIAWMGGQLDDWNDVCGATRDSIRKGMSAALTAALKQGDKK